MSQDKNKKILIVDDELDILEMNASLLETEGYEVLTASSGAEAIEVVQKTPPDLVLLDIMMPDMDGHEVLKSIRTESPENMIPVVMVTARNDVVDIGRALDQFVNGFVVKPFDIERLLRLVDSVIGSGPATFYANYDRVQGITSHSGTGYQQGDRIIFLDVEELDPPADVILDALDDSEVNMMSILQLDSDRGTRQSSILLTAETGTGFGAFINTLFQTGKVKVTSCQIFKDQLDLPDDLLSSGQDYSLE
jgi:two-component system, OmpR family, response regulator VicR